MEEFTIAAKYYKKTASPIYTDGGKLTADGERVLLTDGEKEIAEFERRGMHLTACHGGAGYHTVRIWNDEKDYTLLFFGLSERDYRQIIALAKA